MVVWLGCCGELARIAVVLAFLICGEPLLLFWTLGWGSVYNAQSMLGACGGQRASHLFSPVFLYPPGFGKGRTRPPLSLPFLPLSNKQDLTIFAISCSHAFL